jgi:ferredoxin
MIITEKKPLEEVLRGLEGYSRIAIIGCGRCATSCQTGGEKQVAEMAKLLQSKGYNVIYSGVVEALCDERLARKVVSSSQGADAYLSMGCGSGSSALGDLADLPVIPSNNTMFLGVVKRFGDYSERCSMCGECILADTMGVCVKTRCGKGLLNGPCGGSSKGKCEIGGGRECAWALVVEKLKKTRKLEALVKRRKAVKVRK